MTTPTPTFNDMTQLPRIIYNTAISPQSTSFYTFCLELHKTLTPHLQQPNVPNIGQVALLYHLKHPLAHQSRYYNHAAKTFPTSLYNALLLSLEQNSPNTSPQQSLTFKEIADPTIIHDATLESFDLHNEKDCHIAPKRITSTLFIFHYLFIYTVIQETIFSLTWDQDGNTNNLFKQLIHDNGQDGIDKICKMLQKSLQNVISSCNIPIISNGVSNTTFSKNGVSTIVNQVERDVQQFFMDNAILPIITCYRSQLDTYLQTTLTNDNNINNDEPIECPFFKPTITFIQLSRWLEVLLDCSTVIDCLYIIPYLETLASIVTRTTITTATTTAKNGEDGNDNNGNNNNNNNNNTSNNDDEDDDLALFEQNNPLVSSNKNMLIRLASSSKIFFPRALNMYSRRLSNVQYARLKGRINLLSSFIFNVDDRFLVNLTSTWNNTISYDHHLQHSDDFNDDADINNPSTRSAVMVLQTITQNLHKNIGETKEKGDTKTVVSATVTSSTQIKKDKTTTTVASNTTTHTPLIPQITSLSQFFAIFWSVQSVFSSPQVLSDEIELKKFLYTIDILLTFFETQNIKSNSFDFRIKTTQLTEKTIVNSSTVHTNCCPNNDMSDLDAKNNNNNTNNNNAQSQTTDDTVDSIEIPFFPRYLPSKSLFSLQLYDVNIRTSILLQFIFFTNLLYIIPPEGTYPGSLLSTYSLAKEMAKELGTFTHLTQRAYVLLAKLEQHAQILPPPPRILTGLSTANDSITKTSNDNVKSLISPELQTALANASRLNIDNQSITTPYSIYQRPLSISLNPYNIKPGVLNHNQWNKTFITHGGRLNIHILHRILRITEARWLQWKLQKCYNRLLHINAKYPSPAINSLFQAITTSESLCAPQSKSLDAAIIMLSRNAQQYINPPDINNGDNNDKNNNAKNVDLKTAIFGKSKLPSKYSAFLNIPLLQLPKSLFESLTGYFATVKEYNEVKQKIKQIELKKKEQESSTASSPGPKLSLKERLLAGFDDGDGGLGGLDGGGDDDDDFSGMEDALTNDKVKPTGNEPNIELPTIPQPITTAHLIAEWLSNISIQKIATSYTKPTTMSYLLDQLQKGEAKATTEAKATPQNTTVVATLPSKTPPPVAKTALPPTKVQPTMVKVDPKTTKPAPPPPSLPPSTAVKSTTLPLSLVSLLEAPVHPSNGQYIKDIENKNDILDRNDAIPRSELQPYTFIPFPSPAYAVEQLQQHLLYPDDDIDYDDDLNNGIYNNEEYDDIDDDDNNNNNNNNSMSINNQYHFEHFSSINLNNNQIELNQENYFDNVGYNFDQTKSILLLNHYQGNKNNYYQEMDNLWNQKSSLQSYTNDIVNHLNTFVGKDDDNSNNNNPENDNNNTTSVSFSNTIQPSPLSPLRTTTAVRFANQDRMAAIRVYSQQLLRRNNKQFSHLEHDYQELYSTMKQNYTNTITPHLNHLLTTFFSLYNKWNQQNTTSPTPTATTTNTTTTQSDATKTKKPQQRPPPPPPSPISDRSAAAFGLRYILNHLSRLNALHLIKFGRLLSQNTLQIYPIYYQQQQSIHIDAPLYRPNDADTNTIDNLINSCCDENKEMFNNVCVYNSINNNDSTDIYQYESMSSQQQAKLCVDYSTWLKKLIQLTTLPTSSWFKAFKALNCGYKTCLDSINGPNELNNDKSLNNDTQSMSLPKSFASHPFILHDITMQSSSGLKTLHTIFPEWANLRAIIALFEAHQKALSLRPPPQAQQQLKNQSIQPRDGNKTIQKSPKDGGMEILPATPVLLGECLDTPLSPHSQIELSTIDSTLTDEHDGDDNHNGDHDGDDVTSTPATPVIASPSMHDDDQLVGIDEIDEDNDNSKLENPTILDETTIVQLDNPMYALKDGDVLNTTVTELADNNQDNNNDNPDTAEDDTLEPTAKKQRL